jgi:hypothetical protein
VDIKGPTDGGYDIYQVKKYASALKSDQSAPQYFSRFSAVTYITHGDKVFGGTAWRAVAQQPSEAKSAGRSRDTAKQPELPALPSFSTSSWLTHVGNRGPRLWDHAPERPHQNEGGHAGGR